MNLGDIFRDSLKAALRNPGDPSGTLRQFRRLQKTRRDDEEWRRIFGAWVVTHAYIAEKFKESAEALIARRANGEKVKVEPQVFLHEFAGYQGLVRMYANGDANRIEVFYGGVGVPDGDGHGHIVLIRLKTVYWRHVTGKVYINK